MTRDEVCQEFGAWYRGEIPEEVHWRAAEAMADEVVRLRAILDRLREPSEKVLLAAVEAVSYGASYAALMHCIPAAVAAAEQEVRRDER